MKSADPDEVGAECLSANAKALLEDFCASLSGPRTV